MKYHSVGSASTLEVSDSLGVVQADTLCGLSDPEAGLHASETSKAHHMHNGNYFVSRASTGSSCTTKCLTDSACYIQMPDHMLERQLTSMPMPPE